MQNDFSTYQNDQFALSLTNRINNGQVTNFTLEDIAKRTIPCDVSDDMLCLFFDMLHLAQLSRHRFETFQSVNIMERSLDSSVINRIVLLSLDQLVKCINLFNDLSISVRLVGLTGAYNLKNLLINRIVEKVNGDISSFMQISEEALSDIFNTSAQSLQETEKQYNDLVEIFDYNAYLALDNLNNADDKKAIKSKIGFGMYQNDAKEYFNSITRIIEKTNKNIQPTYAKLLVDILRYCKREFQSTVTDKRFVDLIHLVKLYVEQMINERGNRDRDPNMVWINPKGYGIAQEPAPAVSDTPKKGMSWKQIVALLGVGSAAAYALYKYLTQQK